MFWILITCVLIIWLTRRRLRLRRQIVLARKLKTSLRSYPIFGHILNLLGSSEERMRIFEVCGRDAIENGGISKFWFPGQLFLCIADPIVVDAIINTCLEKDGYILSIIKFLIGDASVFAPVPIWRPRRKLMAPAFSMSNLITYTETFSNKSYIMADLLSKEVGKGAFHFSEYVCPYAMDSICETSLGISLNSQESGKHEVPDAIKQLCELGAQIVCQPWLRYETIYKWFPQYKIALHLKKLVWDFAIQAINDKRTSILQKRGLTSQINTNIKGTSYLDHVLQSEDCPSDKTLIEETVSLMIAGFDTSSVSIGFTVLLLSKHLDVQDKLHKELDEVLGVTERLVTYQDLLRLKYLEAVVKETLRLYPPTPLIVRLIDKDITLPSGLTLVEGCAALINIWAINRNPEYWGPDADEFRPERFLEAPLKHPAAFASFSYGMRGCVGMQYSIMSMKTNLATTLHRYQVLPASANPEEIKTKFEIIMRDVRNYNVRLEYRHKAELK